MLSLLLSPDAWMSLVVLTVMEVVLGIDNIVFITVLSGRLPPEQRPRARRLGLVGALFTRIGLLASLSWLMQLEQPWITVVRPWSGRELVLLFGGLFLLYKATKEIYEHVEYPEGEHEDRPLAQSKGRPGLAMVVGQIAVLDIVFSLDSVITAVGMARHLEVMVAAVLIAVMVMMVFINRVADFIEANPSLRVLALAFLVLIGVMLIMEATGQPVSKGYLYSAMAFAFWVQLCNVRMDARRRAKGLPL